MDRWNNKVVLVTGASSGIGLDLTRTLLQSGMTVAGCARRVDRISEQVPEELRGNLKSYKCDLSNPEEVEELFGQVKNDLGPIDACVVNAGLTAGGKMAEGSIEEWKQMLDVNVLAASQCAKLSLKHMREKQEGALIFVNSMSGHTVHPHPSTRFYSATKFATTALIEGWRAEAREVCGSRVRVCSVSPRLVRTEFTRGIFPDDPVKAEAIFDSGNCLEPEDVSQAILYILSSSPRVEVQDIRLSPVGGIY